MTAELPPGIVDRARQLAALHRTHRPAHELIEAAHLVTEMLHIAVHGETWARPEPTADVWLGLLTDVIGLRRGGPGGN